MAWFLLQYMGWMVVVLMAWVLLFECMLCWEAGVAGPLDEAAEFVWKSAGI